MKRPETFDDIKGHPWLVNYLTDHLVKGTLPHFIILEGQEGLGKTSIADLLALYLVYGIQPSELKKKAYEDVVVSGKSNDNIKRFACSVEGGKDAAREIKDEMNTTFTVSGPKVIICDECHGLTDQAQDVFLAETEFIPEKVYIIMLTTEVSKLKASLQSRAVVIHMNPLKQSDMVAVLRNEVKAKRLNVQNEDVVLTMIAEWAECKPRAGLNILNAFNSDMAVSVTAIRELIGYMDVKDILPLLASLAGSVTFGLSYIAEMPISQNLASLVVECIAIKSGNASYKLKMNEITMIREQLTAVTVDQLVSFLYGITRFTKLTRTDVINAYIGAHPSRQLVTKADTRDVLASEDIQRADIQMEIEHEGLSKAPTLDDLLITSKVIN